MVANVPWGVSTFKAGSSLPALNISDAEGYTGYVGLNTLVLADPQGQFVTSVDVSSPVNCTSEYGLEACDQCTQSLNGLHTAIIIGLVTQFPQLITDISRSTHRGDINFHKFIGMFAAFFGGGDQIYTLYSFRNSCSGVGGDAVATYPGISLVLFGLAMAFRYIDFIAHALLKTPPRARGMKDERVEQAAAVERNISSGHLSVSV